MRQPFSDVFMYGCTVLERFKRAQPAVEPDLIEICAPRVQIISRREPETFSHRATLCRAQKKTGNFPSFFVLPYGFCLGGCMRRWM